MTNAVAPLITAEQREKFLQKLADCGNVLRSAREAGISRGHVYWLKQHEPEFAKRWKEAEGELPERVRDAVVDEAIEGTPVLDENGKLVGHRRNTKLLERLAERVDVFDKPRPQVAIQNNQTVNVPSKITSQADRDALIKVLDGDAAPARDPDEDLL